MARQYGRCGYRRVMALLRDAGWHVNRKRVERIWRNEGLNVPQTQPTRGRFWLNDGSCIRLRPEYPGHVWSYDFVEGRTHDGHKFRILSIIDEASRECLALPVARRLRSEDVLAAMAELLSRLYRPIRRTSRLIVEGARLRLLLKRARTLAETRILIGAWGAGTTAAQSLGYRPSAQKTGTPPWLPVRFRFVAPPPASHGAGGSSAPTINVDHSVGAGQSEPIATCRALAMNLPLGIPHRNGSSLPSCGQSFSQASRPPRVRFWQ